MKIKESWVLHQPRVVWIIISEWMDTLAILMNSKVYMLYDEGVLRSICCVKNYGRSQELGIVITRNKYRKKGYMSKLLRYVVKKYDKLYLISYPELEKFYKKFGFRMIQNAPLPISVRANFYNFFARILGLKPVILMKR